MMEGVVVNPINWNAVLAGAGILVSCLGAMLGVGYKAIVRLLVSHLQQTVSMYEDKVAGVEHSFANKLAHVKAVASEKEKAAAARQAALEKKATALERELRTVTRNLSRDYVSREDHLKSLTVLEFKVDNIGNRIFQMAKEQK